MPQPERRGRGSAVQCRGRRESRNEQSPDPLQHPAPYRHKLLRPGRATEGFPGYLHACSLTETAGAALVNKEDYFCPLFNHGMQFVHSAEAGGTVQVTVRSLSGKGLDFISKSECSLLGL